MPHNINIGHELQVLAYFIEHKDAFGSYGIDSFARNHWTTVRLYNADTKSQPSSPPFSTLPKPLFGIPGVMLRLSDASGLSVSEPPPGLLDRDFFTTAPSKGLTSDALGWFIEPTDPASSQDAVVFGVVRFTPLTNSHYFLQTPSGPAVYTLPFGWERKIYPRWFINSQRLMIADSGVGGGSPLLTSDPTQMRPVAGRVFLVYAEWRHAAYTPPYLGGSVTLQHAPVALAMINQPVRDRVGRMNNGVVIATSGLPFSSSSGYTSDDPLYDGVANATPLTESWRHMIAGTPTNPIAPDVYRIARHGVFRCELLIRDHGLASEITDDGRAYYPCLAVDPSDYAPGNPHVSTSTNATLSNGGNWTMGDIDITGLFSNGILLAGREIARTGDIDGLYTFQVTSVGASSEDCVFTITHSSTMYGLQTYQQNCVPDGATFTLSGSFAQGVSFTFNLTSGTVPTLDSGWILRIKPPILLDYWPAHEFILTAKLYYPSSTTSVWSKEVLRQFFPQKTIAHNGQLGEHPPGIVSGSGVGARKTQSRISFVFSTGPTPGAVGRDEASLPATLRLVPKVGTYFRDGTVANIRSAGIRIYGIRFTPLAWSVGPVSRAGNPVDFAHNASDGTWQNFAD